jgi:hypothetical protein
MGTDWWLVSEVSRLTRCTLLLLLWVRALEAPLGREGLYLRLISVVYVTFNVATLTVTYVRFNRE